MERRAFRLRILPGTETDYEARHQAVYEDLLRAFQEVGIKTYSIFRDGTTLFAYMEVDGFESAMRKLDEHPANTRWQEFMSDILIRDEHGQTMQLLPEVFHFQSDVDVYDEN
ncbi:L-rhamnose mutarotase [Alicyclobacillus kakegawensis]|uniref:L-rhamnose mutarotase n=1 Tax=Alicyclobacillus kakegawensis TaxID=392012 RepID=UPI0009FB7054|nr:L-rhamnose mutarotase [Alicyclobacillus kakegawensis]